jgi:hypothetical protein
MEIFANKRLTLELRDEDLDDLRQVVKLAHDRLRNSPKTKIRGVPIEKQAGICGPELFRVKGMLEKIGKAVGIELSYDAEPNDKPHVPHIVIVTIEEINQFKEEA